MGDDCIEAVEFLYHYIDGELSDERRVVIRRHLDDCPPCLKAFDFEAELRVVIAQRCRDRVPDHLVFRISAALQELQGPSGPSEREVQGPSGPSEREVQGPSGPSEREVQGPSGPSEREVQGPSGPSQE